MRLAHGCVRGLNRDHPTAVEDHAWVELIRSRDNAEPLVFDGTQQHHYARADYYERLSPRRVAFYSPAEAFALFALSGFLDTGRWDEGEDLLNLGRDRHCRG